MSLPLRTEVFYATRYCAKSTSSSWLSGAHHDLEEILWFLHRPAPFFSIGVTTALHFRPFPSRVTAQPFLDMPPIFYSRRSMFAGLEGEDLPKFPGAVSFTLYARKCAPAVLFFPCVFAVLFLRRRRRPPFGLTIAPVTYWGGIGVMGVLVPPGGLKMARNKTGPKIALPRKNNRPLFLRRPLTQAPAKS
jgi:hypothetical protein